MPVVVDFRDEGEQIRVAELRSQLAGCLYTDLQLSFTAQAGDGGLLHRLDNPGRQLIHFSGFVSQLVFFRAENNASSARSAS